MTETAVADRKECPFGIDARFCEHQETRTKDLSSAIQGDLVFLCKLDKFKKCPRMEDLFKEVMEE